MDREEFILSFLKYAERLAYTYERYAEFDDISQEAMLVVCRIVAGECTADNPEAYIYTAMKNAVYTLLGNTPLVKPEFAVRHRHTPNEIVIRSMSLLEDFDIKEKVAVQNGDWQWLYDLVDLLPASQRTVIGYFFGLPGYGKLPMDEMARKLGYRSMGTISGAKERALQNLRKHLAPSCQQKHVENAQLRAVRLSRGWTAKETGRLLGMKTPRNYERWERGEFRPSEENRVKLCDLFGMTPQELGFMEAEEKREEGHEVKEE